MVDAHICPHAGSAPSMPFLSNLSAIRLSHENVTLILARSLRLRLRTACRVLLRVASTSLQYSAVYPLLSPARRHRAHLALAVPLVERSRLNPPVRVEP